ncbi:FAD dependent sulfhydryl oxidase Erv2, putative [Penicillium digitatum PHI26]|uniref:Sulfhydryl oxidase n=2 Tax=Penicillium digitatum TaxID=36651 RepID=K9GEN8_PEND2|nr:FAD dependent sulfhydryl oxidase Erv2, putative [Penicillium digitatum Pd1]EKV10976.1 FAD dependent sulfhydryl oxidase Erv2, putative [Penicillium digitatum Pd1]EKV11741.1 FAD dependent sulfhydryl oxidase Erv2, putative [Penicillium digitatum PHI26]
MASRQITRRIVTSASIALCLIFFLFIRPQGPPSPAIRAPGHIDHSAPASAPGITIQDSTLKGDVIMPKLGNETVNGECAEHFMQHLSKYPPQVSSRNAASGWACFVHNEVNTMLDKPEFDCTNLGEFYDCGCGGDEKEGEPKEVSAASRPDTGKEGTGQHDGPAVEISKEETTRG